MKKILWVGESSFLNTGYATYSREILKRLYATGKYKIAELGAYGRTDDPRVNTVPWRFYGVLPFNEQEAQIYNSSPTNQFGEWRFNEVVLDFKPDICVEVRDPWMFGYEETSALRPYYRWAIMPTVDSAPQQEGWISTFMNADAVFCYSEFGTDTLRKESNNKIKLQGEASPGTNPVTTLSDKKVIRSQFGINEDCLIVGTVMRNQRRKLFPELFKAFRKFCDKHPNLAEKTYLYCHTSYPDLGWDLPRLLREYNIGHKVLFTYICETCGAINVSFFSDARTNCKHCKKMTAMMPNTQRGVPPEHLHVIYELFDIYVQYSICEGFGIPLVEAAASAVPIMAVNYSAMESILKNLNGIPIDVALLYREPETHAYRAYPDEDDFVTKLAKFLHLPNSLRMKKSRDTLLACRKLYNWDIPAKKWETYFDDCTPCNIWKRPPQILEPIMEIPPLTSPEELVRWAILNVLKDPKMLNSYIALRMIRDLNYGQKIHGHGGPYYVEESAMSQQKVYKPYTPQDMLNELYTIRQDRNYWEARRCGLVESVPSMCVQSVKPDERDIEQ